MVTSPSGGEGKTTTAANLAVAFAHQGQRVLLVDCDLRHPRLHAMFALPREPGIVDVVEGSAELETCIRETEVDRLSLLSAGRAPLRSAADILTRDVLRALLDRVGVEFDLVIVDSPPVLLTADAPILATQVDGVLLVVRAGQTERDSAQYAVQQLGALGATVVGAVLNDSNSENRKISTYSVVK
jgi:capsular exopolysaccharide synthesis family protein